MLGLPGFSFLSCLTDVTCPEHASLQRKIRAAIFYLAEGKDIERGMTDFLIGIWGENKIVFKTDCVPPKNILGFIDLHSFNTCVVNNFFKVI